MKGSGRDPHVIARSSRPFGLLVFLFPHKSLSCFYKCLVSFLLQPLPVNSCDKIICSALFLAPWFQHKHIGNIYVYGFSITPGSRYVYIRICPYDLILKKKKKKIRTWGMQGVGDVSPAEKRREMRRQKILLGSEERRRKIMNCSQDDEG